VERSPSPQEINSPVRKTIRRKASTPTVSDKDTGNVNVATTQSSAAAATATTTTTDFTAAVAIADDDSDLQLSRRANSASILKQKQGTKAVRFSSSFP
jgi:hypothetical protein